MNWTMPNFTGSNRLSRAFLLRYSTDPLALDSTDGETTRNTSISTGVADKQFDGSTAVEAVHNVAYSFAHSFLHVTRHVPGRAVQRNTSTTNAAASSQPHGSLPIDVEKTVTCFCRKARRKERDGDQNATDTKLYLEESVLERKLPEADLKALVDLPAGLDYNEWLASHTLALFEHVNLVYGTISEFCTPSGCPDMMGPTNRTYMWFDEKGKKTRVTAPQYIDYVMTFTQKNVSDELIFPTKYANEFPTTFESIARKILRLQFHVIAHLYAAHFREIALLGLHTHLNLTFAHLTALHRRFNLIDEKETDVLRDLELALRLTDDNNSTTNSNNNLNNVNNTNNNNSSGIITTTTTTTNNNNNKNFNNTIITTAITTSATTSNNCCNNTYNINNNNNHNISNNKNSNNYYNQQQQQQLQPNQTLCGENTDGDNIMGNTTTTTTMAIGCQTTANNNDNGTNNSLFGDNLIDGDASIPPICAQPEITANKLLNTNQIAPASTTQPTIDTIDAIQYHNVEQQQQQQHQQQHHHQQQQQQKTLEHVHTRLIQCNAPNSGNLHYSSSSNSSSSNNTNNNIGNNSNFTSTYLIDGKRTASKY